LGFEGMVFINSYSVLLLIIMFVYSYKYSERTKLQHRIFLLMIIFSIIMLIFDTLGRFDGHAGAAYPILNRAGNFTVFLLNPVIPSLWFVYVHNQINKSNTVKKRVLYALISIFILNAAMVILSQFNGWLYTIDANNIYRRGCFFWIESLGMLAIVAVSYVIIIKHKNDIEPKYFKSLLLFAVPLFLSVLVQTLVYGVSLIYNSIVLSLFIILLNIQNSSMHTDYLTGVNNRKKLDQYLKEKILSCTENNSFSLILIDINNFKAINDSYGHIVGDDALEVFVQHLKNCLRSTDFIARYGGDEFVIILNVSDIKALKATVGRINDYFKNFNKNTSKPYKIELSMGYDVYDCKSKMSANEFIKHVDLLMYKSKKENKEYTN